ncbi:hypothetical protein B0H16DRAFT_1344247 [Mycena metata]|uniref:Uncharacterized protein n=1 Tax=Mycena metata TaxID=1033252 RepID=A0AAD7H267_9AGAR|nr:hypothetical protein B0H16DRAFT_1344247 [Mycena metata]
MTPRRWADATVVFNTRLQALSHKSGHHTVNKHPRALLDKLGEVEPRIIQRIADKNYKSAKGSTTFWTTHCNAVSFVKLEAGSPGNHKKVYCSDGFKPKLTGDSVAPWPLPAGIFTDGIHFHPFSFLAQVREVYDRLILDRVQHKDLNLEHDVFLKLLEARLDVDGPSGNALFRTFEAFTIPAEDMAPGDLTVVYSTHTY